MLKKYLKKDMKHLLMNHYLWLINIDKKKN